MASLESSATGAGALSSVPSSSLSHPLSSTMIKTMPSATQVGNASGFGYALISVLSFLPVALLWLITFTTITLPTWLFTLFSMSLTFTMNFTTL